MRKTLVMLMTLSLVLMVTACGKAVNSSPDENVALTFYYPTQVGGDLANGMEDLVEDFNRTHDGITVTPVYTGSYKNTAQTAMTDISGGKTPHVILSGLLDIRDYYQVGAVKNLNDLISQEGPDWKKDFIDGFWGNFVYEDGGTYGLPYQHSICVLYCNMDILRAAGVNQAPKTWDEYLDACQKVKAYDRSLVTMEFPSDVWILEALTLSDGDKLCDNRGKTRFDSEAAVTSLELMKKMLAEGGMIQNYAAAAEDFAAESCAMMLNTTGNLGLVREAAAFDWQVSLVPVKVSPGLSYGGGGLIMLNGHSAAEEAASWEFMTWMTEPQQSARWMQISGYFCVRKSCDTLDEVKAYYAANPQAKQAEALLKYTTAQWTTDHYWDVYGCMQRALDSALLNNKEASAVLTQAQKESMAIINSE